MIHIPPRTENPALPSKVNTTRPIEVGWKIICDTQEGRAGWMFKTQSSGSDQGTRLYKVETVTEKLLTGDYSLIDERGNDLRNWFCIERKTISDLCGSLINIGDNDRRTRFAEEHERLAEIKNNGGQAFVIIEGSPDQACDQAPGFRSVMSTWRSWLHKYGVEWIWAGNRHTAEYLAFDLMLHAISRRRKIIVQRLVDGLDRR